jgi:hypothetical protein
MPKAPKHISIRQRREDEAPEHGQDTQPVPDSEEADELPGPPFGNDANRMGDTKKTPR